MDSTITCPDCKGQGFRSHEASNSLFECPTCEGRGKLIIDLVRTLRQNRKKLPERSVM